MNTFADFPALETPLPPIVADLPPPTAVSHAVAVVAAAMVWSKYQVKAPALVR